MSKNFYNKVMVSFEKFRELALSFPGSEELPHFEKASFRVKKKIFATLNVAENRACLKFNEIDQSVFCGIDKAVIYPVPNKWGKQGWTLVDLNKVNEDVLMDAISTSYNEVAVKKSI